MNTTVKEIEAEIEGVIVKEHCCSENDIPNLQRVLLVGSSRSANPEWGIYNLWLANEIDVKGGEAKDVGEVLHYSMMAAKYCPFCGSKLTNDK